MDVGIIRSMGQGGAICRFSGREIAALLQRVPKLQIEANVIRSVNQSGAICRFIRLYCLFDFPALSKDVSKLQMDLGIIWSMGQGGVICRFSGGEITAFLQCVPKP